MDTIGERLKTWRKENNLTLIDISKKTGLSTGGLSAYERDEKLIGSKTLLALWREYKIDIAWILTGKQEGELTPEELQLVEAYRKGQKYDSADGGGGKRGAGIISFTDWVNRHRRE